MGISQCILLVLTLFSWDCLPQTVVPLTTDNLAEILSSENIVLVNYYAPWCGHCETLSPILDDVAREAFELELSAKITSLDVSDEQFQPLLKHENITGYPTLLLYKNGIRLTEYQGHRTVKDILDYIKLKVGPTSRLIHSQEELVPFISLLENTQTFEQHNLLAIVLGLFVNATTEESLQTRPSFTLFSQLATRYDLALFFHAVDPTVLQAFEGMTTEETTEREEDCLLVFTGEKHDTYHRILLSPPLPTPPTPTDATATTSQSEKEKEDDQAQVTAAYTEEIMQQILTQSLPVSIAYSTETLPLLDSIPVNSHVLVFYDHQGSDDTFVDMMLSMVAQYKGQLLLVEVSDAEYTLLHHFNILPADLPQVVIVKMSGSEEEGDNEESLRRYHFIDYLTWRTQQGIDPMPTSSRQTHANLHPKANVGQDLHAQTFLLKRRITAEEELLYAFNTTHVQSFLEGYLQQSIYPSILSENAQAMEQLNQAIPMNHNPEHRLFVENIVSMQWYNRLYNHPDSYLFFYFHAPWCIHCKALEPLILDLAERMQEDTAFQIYRMDGSKNEILYPGIKIRGFPTIYLLLPVQVRSSSSSDGNRNNMTATEMVLQRKVVEFDGERTIEALLAFVQTHRVDVIPSQEESNNDSESDTSNNEIEVKGEEAMCAKESCEPQE